MALIPPSRTREGPGVGAEPPTARMAVIGGEAAARAPKGLGVRPSLCEESQAARTRCARRLRG